MQNHPDTFKPLNQNQVPVTTSDFQKIQGLMSLIDGDNKPDFARLEGEVGYFRLLEQKLVLQELLNMMRVYEGKPANALLYSKEITDYLSRSRENTC